MEVYESNGSVEVLHQSRAALHPIAAIHVGHAAIFPNFRAMNVTADHALHILLVRHLHDRVLKIADVFHRCLRLVFQVSRHGPIAETEAATNAVEVQIEIENPVVEPRADAVQQPIEMRDAVELMSVQHEKAFAVSGRVNHLIRQHHAAEVHPNELFQAFVVIACDVDDLRFLTALAKQFLDQNVVAVLPVPLVFELPAVDEIADEIEIAAIDFAEEIQQHIHLGVLCAEVNVGDPDRAESLRALLPHCFSACDHSGL
jgi:hypothetical protein